jgi:CDP-glucose 4,6-dehydratase
MSVTWIAHSKTWRTLCKNVSGPPRQFRFDWTTRRVLVTGADGFVGRWLVPALAARGAFVCALLWSNVNNEHRLRAQEAIVEIAQGDVKNLDFISALMCNSKIDTVYHLAAINTNTGSTISPYDIFETNIRGTYTVLEACRRMSQPVRAVVSSSKEVEDCFRTGTARKFHPYMASKASAELISKTYLDTASIPTVVVRPDNLYGGGDLNWNRLIPGAMREILHGKSPVIRSNGLLQRDYVYVEDAVAAYLAIGERLDDPEVRGQLFRIATGTGTSVLDVVKQIASVAGRPDLKPQVLNETSEERIDSFYVPELERVVLGWSSRISLREGLSRTCEWYKDYFRKQN